MTLIVMYSSPFAVRFWHRFGFTHHRKAWRGRPLPAFAPPGRFSARFGRKGWCANLLQNGRHHATNLTRGDRALGAFPGTQDGQPKVFGHQQQITGTRHDPTPAFHLLRRAQVRVFPEQVLLEKAIAVLVGEALAVPGTHLLQGDVLFPSPDEPTDARVAFAVAGAVPVHPAHT